MKRIIAVLCLFSVLVLTFASCGKTDNEPKVARKEADLTSRLAENGKLLAGLAARMDALIATVTPDRQHTAMIIIRENMEKASLVCMYESQVMNGVVASMVQAPNALARNEKFTQKSVVSKTSSDALARYAAATEKALPDIYNRDARKMAAQFLDIASDSAELLKKGVALASEEKDKVPPAPAPAVDKPGVQEPEKPAEH